MCTRGKVFSLGRSIGSSKFIQQKFQLTSLYQHRPRQYGALCIRKMDCPVQNSFFSRSYAKDGSKRSTSLINGLKGTITAVANGINGIADMCGLLGQLIRQAKNPNSMELYLEEQHCEKEDKKAKALKAVEDRKQKIWDDANLLSRDNELEACCKKMAADKKKKEAAKKKKQLEECCKKMAADKKKKKEEEEKRKALEACCKKKEAEKKRKALEACCKKMAEEKKKKC